MGSKVKGLLKSMGPAWIISAVACGRATLASVSMAGGGPDLIDYNLSGR